MEAKSYPPAGAIDPEYAKKLKSVAKQGVEVMAYDVIINLESITINRKIPCLL